MACEVRSVRECERRQSDLERREAFDVAILPDASAGPHSPVVTEIFGIHVRFVVVILGAVSSLRVKLRKPKGKITRIQQVSARCLARYPLADASSALPLQQMTSAPCIS
jgi:hypothetical protein